jgi:hypothetical protein
VRTVSNAPILTENRIHAVFELQNCMFNRPPAKVMLELSNPRYTNPQSNSPATQTVSDDSDTLPSTPETLSNDKSHAPPQSAPSRATCSLLVAPWLKVVSSNPYAVFDCSHTVSASLGNHYHPLIPSLISNEFDSP